MFVEATLMLYFLTASQIAHCQANAIQTDQATWAIRVVLPKHVYW